MKLYHKRSDFSTVDNRVMAYYITLTSVEIEKEDTVVLKIYDTRRGECGVSRAEAPERGVPGQMPCNPSGCEGVCLKRRNGAFLGDVNE